MGLTEEQEKFLKNPKNFYSEEMQNRAKRLFNFEPERVKKVFEVEYEKTDTYSGDVSAEEIQEGFEMDSTFAFKYNTLSVKEIEAGWSDEEIKNFIKSFTDFNDSVIVSLLANRRKSI